MKKRRSLAVLSNDKFYFTGNACVNGHSDKRYTSNGVCVSCHIGMAEYRSEWEKKNPEKMREKRKRGRKAKTANQRKYRKEFPERTAAWSHNRRARVNGAGGVYCDEDIKKILSAQLNKCAEPTCRIDLSGGYHVDHIMPISLGGSSWPDNIQCLCPTCNLRKGPKHPIDWANKNGRLL